MADVNAIYAELCSAMEEGQDVDAGLLGTPDGGVVSPILVSVFGRWIASKVKELTCENAAVILEAANKWISTFVKNEQAAAVLTQVAEMALSIVCSQPQ